MKKTISALLIIPILIWGRSIGLEHYDADYRISYERTDITGTEKMGLVGLNMLFDINSYWYGGMGLYGAVDGERGGFFTVGIDTGMRYDLYEYIGIKSGIFIGAGGGGSAPQGGGLMLRPYAELSYYTDDYAIGLGVSHIEFPNGDITSSQAYLSLEVPTDGSYLKGHSFDDASSVTSTGKDNDKEDLEISFLIEHYRPNSGSLNRDSVTPTEPYSLAGIKFKKEIGNSFYSYFQAAGAGDGSSAGYMEIFGGLGYEYRIADLPLYLGLEAAIGASGGGKVDTGGGLGFKSQATVKVDITNNIALGISAGIVKSADGTFSATSYEATLRYRTSVFDSIPNDPQSETDPSAYSFRILNKSYMNGEDMFKDPERDVSRVDLLGFAIDWYLSENFYITGQTYWAYKGKAGGYAEGIFGLGYHSGTYHGWSLYIEALAGVGGGGGIDIGGGLWGSVEGGISYAIDDSWSLTLGTGYVKNKASTFSTADVTFGLQYSFSLLESK